MCEAKGQHLLTFQARSYWNFALHNSCHPNKHKTFVQHLYNASLTSWTLVQHCINVIEMFVFAGMSVQSFCLKGWCSAGRWSSTHGAVARRCLSGGQMLTDIDPPLSQRLTPAVFFRSLVKRMQLISPVGLHVIKWGLDKSTLEG